MEVNDVLLVMSTGYACSDFGFLDESHQRDYLDAVLAL